MPQRTARRASRFFWLRLFFESESESLIYPPSSKSVGDGALGNLRPRGRLCTLRLEAVVAGKERQGEIVLEDIIKEPDRR